MLQALGGSFVPDFEVIVDDLAQVSEQELLQRKMPAVPKLVLWALRVVRGGFDPSTIGLWAKELYRAERRGPGRRSSTSWSIL